MQTTNLHQGVSNLRFFGMASVVAVHAFPHISKTDNIVLLALLELVKFGTIGFFFRKWLFAQYQFNEILRRFFQSKIDECSFAVAILDIYSRVCHVPMAGF